MLEPYAVKVASTVLKGLEAGNSLQLLDYAEYFINGSWTLFSDSDLVKTESNLGIYVVPGKSRLVKSPKHT